MYPKEHRANHDANPRGRTGARDLHVKAVPESIWIRARCNATRSGLSFKDYLIRILESSEPLPCPTQEAGGHM